MAQGRRLHLTWEEQGRRWRQAGGPLKGCWYRDGSVERRLWEKGWHAEDEHTRAFLEQFDRTERP